MCCYSGQNGLRQDEEPCQVHLSLWEAVIPKRWKGRDLIWVAAAMGAMYQSLARFLCGFPCGSLRTALLNWYMNPRSLMRELMLQRMQAQAQGHSAKGAVLLFKPRSVWLSLPLESLSTHLNFACWAMSFLWAMSTPSLLPSTPFG